MIKNSLEREEGNRAMDGTGSESIWWAYFRTKTSIHPQNYKGSGKL